MSLHSGFSFFPTAGPLAVDAIQILAWPARQLLRLLVGWVVGGVIYHLDPCRAISDRGGAAVHLLFQFHSIDLRHESGNEA